MESFIAANPAVALWFMGVLLSFIGILIVMTGRFGKRYIDELSITIRAFTSALEVIKADIGIIKDRMQRQETICEMQRKFCPNWKAVAHALTGGHSECPAQAECERIGG